MLKLSENCLYIDSVIDYPIPQNVRQNEKLHGLHKGLLREHLADMAARH
jgi:hypothetical protein